MIKAKFFHLHLLSSLLLPSKVIIYLIYNNKTLISKRFNQINSDQAALFVHVVHSDHDIR